MQTDVLVVGGGLSGLTTTWQLRRAGVDATLLEARPRFGGRILTVDITQDAHCDLGPSWFWTGQPLVAGLLKHFSIPSYEQYASGTILVQQADGRVVRAMEGSPMAGSLRIEGGISRLTTAIACEIDPAHCLSAHVVRGLSLNNDLITADVMGPSGPMQVEAKQVAIAIPPRLAAALPFTPELPAEAMQRLTTTPTWMAGHAKFFATYDRPFWREKALCGSAISRRGPLAEIHDASPNSGDTFCLFGFAGVDAESRARVGEAAFIKEAVLQLTAIFGDEAGHPTATYLQDWSTEEFTAGAADRQPQSSHPDYGLNLQLGSAWDDKLAFISTETSFNNGGLIEGALEAALRFSKRITAVEMPVNDEAAIPHHASMDWDWL